MSLSVCQPNNTIAPLRRGFSHADVLPPLTKHRHDLTKMTPTISATSRKWSARHALPPPCSSTPFSLPLPTKTQNGSQGRFCAKEGISKMTTSQLRTAGGGMVVCICPPYIQIKKEEEFSPMGVVRRVCAFLYSLLSALSASSALSALSVSSAPYHIWYGGQQADNRQGALRICCPP